MISRYRRLHGALLSFEAFMLTFSLASMYAFLGLWFIGMGDYYVLASASQAFLSYLFYRGMQKTYYRWRILYLADVVKGFLNQDLVDQSVNREVGSYVALFAVTSFARTKNLRWNQTDAVFFEMFPDAKMTVGQRRILGEACDLAPLNGWSE